MALNWPFLFPFGSNRIFIEPLFSTSRLFSRSRYKRGIKYFLVCSVRILFIILCFPLCKGTFSTPIHSVLKDPFIGSWDWMRYLCVFSLLLKTVPCKIYLRLDLHWYVEGFDAFIYSLHTSSCWLSIPLFHLGKGREWCVFFMSPKKDFKRSTSI